MSLKCDRIAESHELWESLAASFPDRPEWEQQTVYALPLPFIEAIQRYAPDFLAPDDIEFEKALTEASGMGFCMKRPFHFPLLKSFHSPTNSELSDVERKWLEIDAKLQKLKCELMADNGRTEFAIQEHFALEEKFQKQADERCRGYAGWLITNPEFQRDKLEFQQKWEQQTEKEGMPSFPKMKMMSDQNVLRERREFYSDYFVFYSKWGLESLSTWDLPLPLQSNPVKTSPYNEDLLSSVGLNLFLPWYLLVDKHLDLHALAAHSLSNGHMSHLKGWIASSITNNGGWGFRRYSLILELFVYLECGINKRYQDKLRGHTSGLDEALAFFLSNNSASDSRQPIDTESIRKTRQHLKKLLKKSTSI